MSPLNDLCFGVNLDNVICPLWEPNSRTVVAKYTQLLRPDESTYDVRLREDTYILKGVELDQ